MSIDPIHLRVPPGWSINGLYDASTSDPFNFGLGENAVGAISAVFTGLTILLVTDLCFRVVVRSRNSFASSRAVYRRALFARFANPVDGLCALFERKKVARREAFEQYRQAVSPQSDEGTVLLVPFPLWQRCLIAVTGVMLSVAQVALIFCAMNRASTVNVDKTRIPAFDFTELRQPPVYHPPLQDCSAVPLVTKPGFVSQGTVFLCTNDETFFHPDGMHKDLAMVSFILSYSQLFVRIWIDKLDIVYSQSLSISISNGTQYMSISPAIRSHAVEAVPPLFARYGLKVVRTFDEDSALNASNSNWVATFVLDLSENRVPTDVLREVEKVEGIAEIMRSANSTLTVFAWNTYLSGIARSSLALKARSRAYHVNPTTGPFLDEYDGALVIKQRPLLNVGGCVAMCAASFLVWAFISQCVGWGAGVDERVAWILVFESIKNVEDFPQRRDEHVQMEEC